MSNFDLDAIERQLAKWESNRDTPGNSGAFGWKEIIDSEHEALEYLRALVTELQVARAELVERRAGRDPATGRYELWPLANPAEIITALQRENERLKAENAALQSGSTE